MLVGRRSAVRFVFDDEPQRAGLLLGGATTERVQSYG